MNAAALQIPVGLEHAHRGVVDLLDMKQLIFDGEFGESIVESEIPEAMRQGAEEKRQELIEHVANVDDVLAEKWLEEKPVTGDDLRAAIRRSTVANKFIPVMMGAAFKNKGVQLLLDAVTLYLPKPTEVVNTAISVGADKTELGEVVLVSDPDKPMVCYAFKLEEGRFGQLTYMRVYQGTLRRGDTLRNNTTGEKIRVQRLVRMHANEMEVRKTTKTVVFFFSFLNQSSLNIGVCVLFFVFFLGSQFFFSKFRSNVFSLFFTKTIFFLKKKLELQFASAGEICALFGVECDSGTTFSDPTVSLTCSSMHVPEPVISLAITTKDKNVSTAFSKFALFVFVVVFGTIIIKKNKQSFEAVSARRSHVSCSSRRGVWRDHHLRYGRASFGNLH
jgi:translation elongation factor EF-G